MDILHSQVEALRAAVEASGVDVRNIAAIGITNQRETTLMWDRQTGETICGAIVWQCRRTAPLVERLLREGMEAAIRERTGPGAGRVFFRHKDAMDFAGDPWREGESGTRRVVCGHGGQFPRLSLDQRARACNGRDKRLAHHATQHPLHGMGRGIAARHGNSPEHFAPGGGFFADRRHVENGYFGPGHSGGGVGGRPAERAFRPGLCAPGHDEKYLWNRLLYADEHG